MTRNFLKALFGFMLIALMSVCSASAQTVTGSITGSITDPSGAVIPNAHVVAHNLDTGVDSAVTSNASGFYRIDFLPIGHYQVTVEANGEPETGVNFPLAATA